MARPVLALLLLCSSACGGAPSSPIPAADGASTTPPSSTTSGGGGSGPTIVDNGGSVAFAGASEQITRTSAQRCGAPSPYTPNDIYGLEVFGNGLAPRPLLQLTVPASTPVGSPQTLRVFPWQPSSSPPSTDPNAVDLNPESATGGASGLLGVSLARGSDPEYVDAQPFDEATITVLAVPQKDGDTLSLRLVLHFADGKALDQTFVSPTVSSPVTPCGASGG